MHQASSEFQAPYEPPPAYQCVPSETKYGITFNFQAVKKIPILLSFANIVSLFILNINFSQ